MGEIQNFPKRGERKIQILRWQLGNDSDISLSATSCEKERKETNLHGALVNRARISSLERRNLDYVFDTANPAIHTDTQPHLPPTTVAVSASQSLTCADQAAC